MEVSIVYVPGRTTAKPLLLSCKWCRTPFRFIPAGSPIYKDTEWGMCTHSQPCCRACRTVKHNDHTILTYRTPGAYPLSGLRLAAIQTLLPNRALPNAMEAIYRIIPALVYLPEWDFDPLTNTITWNEEHLERLTKPNRPQFVNRPKTLE